MKLIFYVLIPIIFCSCSLEKSEEEYFTTVTGLEITDSIQIISESDSYYIGEGEYSLIFKTSKNQIEKWISEKPPWGLGEWQRDTVDFNIGFHCSFGTQEGSPSLSTTNGTTNYSGNDEAIKILSDTNNHYSFQEICCPEQGDALRFHNGTLLIIKPNKKTVYLSVWDY
jgi:hypothetical protein